DPHNITVELNEGGSEQLNFKNLIIATGAVDNVLPGVELSDRVVTYETQILEDSLPDRMVIVGAGAIGVEFSYILSNYGVDVTLVEYQDRILPLEDEEVSKQLQKDYGKLGVNMLTAHRVEKVDDSGESVVVTMTDMKNEAEVVVEADKVMMAIGFRPRLDGYGLENTGVKLTERGAIDIDDHMRTSVPHIFAIGDVTAKLMLAHVAEMMGVIAAESIVGEPSRTLEYIMMPRATYCQPQVASFGYTEKGAKEAGYDINVSKFPFQANGKALGLNEYSGFVKLISDKQYGEILGAHMIGPNVTELLPELTLAQYAELTPEEVAHNVHAHPTLSEAIKEAAHGLEGHFLNA
ncbi:MAG: FAD-dependent oxidoreductase, partial [Chloroflexota bacterium]